MVGKKSGKALLREEGQSCAPAHNIFSAKSGRFGAYRQWPEADYLARSAHDQPEELLYVCAFCLDRSADTY